ncbi:MAG: CPBP family intramembrane metalloprotease [Planctomycetes bacterium]|nr:CPBP family intramembrane metalloprotease [Planctomycetota bacterium]
MDNPLNLKSAWQDAKDWRVPLIVLAFTAVALTLVEYLFLSGSFVQFFPGLTQQYAPGVWYGSWSATPAGTQAPWWGVFAPWAWWVGGTVTLWVIAPWALAALLGFDARKLGLGGGGLFSKLWIYALLLAIVMIGVWWASTRESFTQVYPFVKPRYCQEWTWAVLLVWWALYGVQFFAVEFFFRGFLLFTLEEKFGMGAIAVMVVPYCMIHYHKPMPEALGAIVAGLVLGWMALKTRSIWGGVLVHVCVAISMDALSLWQQDALPASFGP